MKQLLSFLFLVTCLINVKAQQEPSNSFSGSYNIYPVDSLGVVLLNRDLKQLSSGDLGLSFLGLDASLNKKWENLYPFSAGLTPVFQQITAQGIVVLFADSGRKRYEMVKASSDYGDYERFMYEFSEPVLIEELNYYHDNVWVSGTIGGKPTIFKLKADNTYATVPTGAQGIVKYAGQIDYNEQTKGFNFILLAEVEKRDVLIWRSLTLQGNVLQNKMLENFEKDRVRSVKATYTNSAAYVAGTYSIGTRDNVAGLFWAEIDEAGGSIKRNPMKSVSALTNYRKIAEVASNGFSKAKGGKLKGSSKSYFVDNISVGDAGQISIAVEVFRPEFRSRGALEKQVIARDRVAQLDQNVYGRQNGLSGEMGRDLEGRMDRASATDQLQYRFMGQSLGKAVNQGISYNHTAVITLDSDLSAIDDFGISFDLRDFGALAKSRHMVGDRLKYSAGASFKQFDIASKTARIIEGDELSQLVSWTGQMLLQVTFDRKTKRVKLSGKGFN